MRKAYWLCSAFESEHGLEGHDLFDAGRSREEKEVRKLQCVELAGPSHVVGRAGREKGFFCYGLSTRTLVAELGKLAKPRMNRGCLTSPRLTLIRLQTIKHFMINITCFDIGPVIA